MSGINKWISSTLLVLASSAANAGIYAGIGLGPDTVDFSATSHVINAAPNQPVGFDVINKAHLSATGLFGTLFAGYGALVKNNFYLAAEVNGNVSSTKSKTSNNEFVHQSFTSSTLKINNSFGISVLPGYQFSPTTLFYGRLGYANGKIRQITSDTSLANFSERKNGFRYGLGIKQNITEKVALRMDYSRIDYSPINTATFDPVGIVGKTTRLHPGQQLVEFGLVIKFS